MIPPDEYVIENPDEVLDRIDGLILAGGADIDPAPTAPSPIPTTPPHRARARRVRARAGAPRDRARHAGARHLPRDAGAQRRAGRHAHASTCPISSATRSTAATRAASRQRPRRPARPRLAGRARRRRDQHGPSRTTTRASTSIGDGLVVTGSRRSTTSPEAIEAARRTVRARGPVAPRGRRAQPRDRRARRARPASTARPPPSNEAPRARDSRPRGSRRVTAAAWSGPRVSSTSCTARLAHVQVEPLADVLDVQQVGAGVRHQRQQLRQRPRAVGQPRQQDEPSPGAGSRAAAPPRRAARRRRCRPTGPRPSCRRHRRRIRPDEQRGHAHRPGALDDELGALEQEHHRLGDVVLADDQQLVDPAARSARSVSSPGRLTAIPSAIVRSTRRRPSPASSEARNGAHARPGRRRPDARALRLDRDRDPADQPTAADRDDHARRGRAPGASNSSPTPPWPAITSGSSNGWTNAQPLLGRARARPRATPRPSRPRARTVAPERRRRLDLGDRAPPRA